MREDLADGSVLGQRLRALESRGQLTLPLPGGQLTPARHAALLELGRADLSLARLAEAHTDAMAILAEAGRASTPGRLYGVWAADGPASRIDVTEGAAGSLQLNGVKRYCTGSALVDSALVTAHAHDGLLLLDVALDAPGVTVLADDWAAVAFAETRTATVQFQQVTLRQGDVIGAPGWYLTRAGFWHGALGPAACWAGGAIGLVDAARKLQRRDEHFKAQLGALAAAEWGLRAILEQSGREIDADPLDRAATARQRALMARHLIERSCTDVLDRFGRATGPQLLAFDGATVQRYAELTLYIRQCHAERDLAQIPQSTPA